MESSAKPASVAVVSVLRDEEHTASDPPVIKLLGQYYQNCGLTHSRTLLAMTESLLNSLDLKPVDIGLVAVSHGPGSFTGVRIGVSAAKGIAWGLDKPVCGVSTLEAMAYQTTGYSVLKGADADTCCIICPVMDARREQVYNALFELRGGTLVRLCDDRAISLEDLAVELRGFSAPCILIGDGVEVCQINSGFSHCLTTPELLHYQTAYGVALAAINTEPVPAAELEPSYLRPSQAERERSKL